MTSSSNELKRQLHQCNQQFIQKIWADGKKTMLNAASDGRKSTTIASGLSECSANMVIDALKKQEPEFNFELGQSSLTGTFMIRVYWD